MSHHYIVEENVFSKFFFSNTNSSWFWFIVRMYLGYQWLIAGISKIMSPQWIGSEAGTALTGFVNGGLLKISTAYSGSEMWYADFLRSSVLTHATGWSHFIAWGEVALGIALVFGIFTGVAAACGLFMNMNYLIAGMVGINPILFILSIGVILAWKVAGFIGADNFLLPFVGTLWKHADMTRNKRI